MRNDHQSLIYGLDLAKTVFHLVGLARGGRKVCSKRLRRKPLLTFFAQQPKSIVAMEACPGAHWMARRRKDMGHDVRILPAQYVKPFAQKQKNDANDAMAIAEACQRPNVRPIQIKTVEQQDIQAMHRIRDRLINQRTRLVCQARGLLLEYGIVLRPGVGNCKQQLPNVLEDAENDLSNTSRILIASLRDELSQLEDQIHDITKRIEALAAHSDTTRRLMTIPGVGPMFATALIAAVGDASQFRKARDLGAWLGLVPAQNSTGGKNTLMGISKRGNSYLRRMLIHGARTCVIHLNKDRDQLGHWIHELGQRMHTNKVTVALANKLARIAWAILTRPNQIYRRVDPIYL